ncbi:TonB-dependent receptor domain-containing protein [Marinimicrobium agarilyticum]|uniref:TonB-dependent receptor domain-containing protein n=1 Tax=Marinimicrobium agarilyticum TaxID=306546 RepID=UPI0004052FE6|nr:TonB-dependent receptor [Marinimicrobium agarilyticum]
MPSIAKHFKLTALSAAIFATHGFPAYAQQADDADSQNGENDIELLEEIVVTGIRGALQQSIDDKRTAQNIMDTINAEDMGKNTDQNIADALGRVTGVSVVQRNGEGAQVTVRGAGANQNNISINGQQLTSTSFSQAVDLSSFSTDILSKLEVVKTPSADHDEGSLGASINLVTTRPLDRAEDVRSLTVQGRYNDFSEEEDYKVQASVSETFLDETLGVALTVYDETNTYRRDQYRVEDFEASGLIEVARDQNGDIISGVKAIQPTATFYEQSKNTNDRQGANLGIQWAPTDRTELMFNTTYTKQEETQQKDGFAVRDNRVTNFVEGRDVLPNDIRPPAPFTDPQEDWYTINTDTNTFIKKMNRFSVGDVVSSIGGDERENISATLDFSHEFTDRFRMESKIGYSSSESESLPNAYAVMQNFVQVPSRLLYDAGRDIEPAGFDCTSGSCKLVTGDSFVDLGEQIDPLPDTPAYEDNTAFTGYNPADIASQNLSFLSENAIKVEDELTSFQMDFDYDINTLGLTTIEFGAKASRREKFVDQQNYQFNSITKTEVIRDENDRVIVVPGGPLTDVRGVDVQKSGLEWVNFMDSLGYEVPGIANWVPFDGVDTINLVLDDENTVRTPDKTKTRAIDIDTAAIYLKTNFSFMDDRLTGDLGVRYVKTEVQAEGFGGVDFWQNGETLQREFDLVQLRDLRDTSLPECRAPEFDDPANRKGYEQKYQRVDGQGWDVSAGPDPSGWTPIADQGPCHDPAYAAWAAYQQDQSLPDPGAEINWYTMWRYADVSTVRNGAWEAGLAEPPLDYDSSVSTDNADTNAYSWIDPVNKELKSFAATGSNEYENVLPSLNINYAFTDDLVGRFAVSKTMTRPEIDKLQSGFSITEGGYWGTGDPNVGRFQQFNTQLEPLESKNLDLSLEWYFDDSAMLSAAVFHKDMSNFTDTESAQVYLSDLRSLEGTVDPNDLIMLPANDGTDDNGLTGCMPLRATADYGWFPSDPNRFSDDLRDLCGIYSLEKVINGKGASITGLELGYQQTYHFLPGYFLSGLGMSANYTYQDSEYDADQSSVDPSKMLPTLPVADTPEHTYNLTGFWEQDGHQVRLSYRGSSDSLVGSDWNTGLSGRTWNQGTLWNEGRDSLDLSASYELNDNVSFTFQAINLTDAAFRQYFTSREIAVDRVYNEETGAIDFVALEEGNAMDGETPKSRTYSEFKTGITYRLGVRVSF